MSAEIPAFERVMSRLDYPMFIVTAAAGQDRAGCLVGFASQVSIQPRRFLVCLSEKNFTFRVALRADALAVHPVPDGANELADLFGGETGDDTDKFARWPWRPGPMGTPILDGVDGWFAGKILGREDFGDHTGFVLEPIDAGEGQINETLGLREAKSIEPGHES